VAIEMRWAEGRGERFEEIAAEFVRTKVDVIVTGGGAVTAAKQATSIVPIVFALANDPVGIGLVASLARPGGNVTGLSQQATDLAGKRLELLRAFVPGLGRLAILGNADYPAAVLEMGEVQEAARKLGLDTSMSEIRHAEDIDTVFDAFRGRTQALYVVADPLTGSNRAHINTAALNARLPTMHGIREYTETGGLISYGPSIPIFSGALPNSSIRFCGERNLPICRSSSQPNSSWSSTSRRRGPSASKCPRPCSRSPTR
jgi:putative ABC transport system substrate-binding protein